MPADKLLSICILSYNQSDEVERLLNNLLGQMTNEVEIVIRDDSTDEKTVELVKKYQDQLLIRFFKGKKEGIDRTVIFLTEQALGKFVWWMGDDEIVQGGVAQVLKVIKNQKDLAFIWANYILTQSDKIAMSRSDDGLFESLDQLLELGGAGLGFISCTIFKRELALPHLENSKKYVGSAFTNLYIVLGVITSPGALYYLSGPIVICHPATSEEVKAQFLRNGQIKNPAFEIFGISFAKIVYEFSSSFSYWTLRKVISKSFGCTWRGVLVGSAGGWDTTKGKRLMMMKHFWTFPEAWIAVILFSVPAFINKFFYRLYKKVKTLKEKKSNA